MNRLLFAAGAVGFAAVVACTGGGGDLSGAQPTALDRAPGSQDSVSNSGDNAPSSQDPVATSGETATGTNDTATAGGGSGSTFSCHGTYSCVTNAAGETVTSVVVLDATPSTCSSKGTSINPDGTIVEDGQVVAHWTGSDANFSYSVTDSTGTFSQTCMKISDDTSGASTSGSSGTDVSLDAGHVSLDAGH